MSLACDVLLQFHYFLFVARASFHPNYVYFCGAIHIIHPAKQSTITKLPLSAMPELIVSEFLH